MRPSRGTHRGEADGGGPDEALAEAVLAVSRIRDPAELPALLPRLARTLVDADGAAVAVPEGSFVHYLDEDAIAPLWKGRLFPAELCLSGQALRQRETLTVEDVGADPRVNREAYAPTFVRSLAIVPIDREQPKATLGVYWSAPRRLEPEELRRLEALAGAGAMALRQLEVSEEGRQAVAARDELLDSVAHELRTPLTPLKLAVDALARHVDRDLDPERLRRNAERIAAHLARLEEVVDRLADHARVEAGNLRLVRRRMDLVELVRDVIGRIDGPLRESGSSLVLEVPGPVVGRWDRRRLDEVVTGLLGNAIRFGQGREIGVRIEEEPGRVRLAVRDRGIGIAVEDQERIFRRFERAASSREYGGFGLGLWQARRIAEAHGGLLLVDSRPGEGATFTLLLPR